VSKRPDENETPDVEAGMTTAERRRRRRRGGGLRVPSDNVPRRTPTTPPVVPPVPEDPNLAVSIAYSFNSDGSGPLPRPDTAELAGVEARPDTLTGDGPEVGDIMAPEAQATVVDSEDDEEPFEIKTREMTAVDLEELGLEDPSGDGKVARKSGPITPPAASATGMPAVDSVIIDDLATTLPMAPSRTASTSSPPPSPVASNPALATPPPSPPPRTKGPTPAPPLSAKATPVPFGTVPVPAKLATPAIPESSFGEDERSVEIELDDPSRPGEDGPTLKRSPDPRVGRASTVALSDDDLEELMDGASGRVRAPVKSGETVQLTDTDLEDVRERASTPRLDKLAKATKDESGEIVVDVVEEIDSGDIATPIPQAAPVARASAAASGPVAMPVGNGTPAPRPPPPPPTNPPPLGAPASSAPPPPVPSGHSTNPPPLGTPSSTATPPPSPVVAKGEGTGAPPPPPTAKAPPPAPGKKPTTVTAAAAVAAAAKAPVDKRAKRGKPWFEEIFDEDYLRTLPFLTPQATQAEAQFVIDALAVQSGAQLLDLGCGYGRHAMELAARGFHMVGLDLSLPLLLRGADEAQRRGLSINFVHADMRELDFDAQFDGVYCLFSTFGFFDDETNKKTATSVARALKPGGRCVIEVLNRDYVIGELPTRVWWEGDGCVVLEEVEFNYFSSRIHSNRSVVFDDGRQIEQEISIRAYSLHELGKLLHAAGFRVVEVSGSVHTRGRYFGNHSRHIIVVAEKKPKDASDGGK